jgi:TonB family protein
MRDCIIGLGALLGAAAVHAQAVPTEPAWLVLPLSEGVELRYVPVAVTLHDYPTAARRRGEEGTSVLNLQVDRSGLRACSTAQSSGSPALDEQACLLYRKRGRFDLRGTSQPVTVRAPVRWVLTD